MNTRKGNGIISGWTSRKHWAEMGREREIERDRGKTVEIAEEEDER